MKYLEVITFTSIVDRVPRLFLFVTLFIIYFLLSQFLE